MANKQLFSDCLSPPSKVQDRFRPCDPHLFGLYVRLLLDGLCLRPPALHLQLPAQQYSCLDPGASIHPSGLIRSVRHHYWSGASLYAGTSQVCTLVFSHLKHWTFANPAAFSLRSVISALFWLTIAVAAAICIALGAVSQDPYLVWMYGAVGISGFIAGCVFYICFRKGRKQPISSDEIVIEGTLLK